MLDESLSLAREVGRATPDRHRPERPWSRGVRARRSRARRIALPGKPCLRRRDGSESDIARALNNLGGVALQHERLRARGRRVRREPGALPRRSSDPWGAAGAINGLALAARGQGDDVAAPWRSSPKASSSSVRRATPGTARLPLLGLADDGKAHRPTTRPARRTTGRPSRLSVTSTIPGIADGLAGSGRGARTRTGDPRSPPAPGRRDRSSLPGDAAQAPHGE